MAEYWDAVAEDSEMETEPEPRTCGKGHRQSLSLPTAEGGSICLACFAALLSSPSSPSVHVSYALSQLAAAAGGPNPAFLRSLRTCHAHLLVPPLVSALSSFDDEPLARQIIDLVSLLSGGSAAVSGDFIARIGDRLASGALAWSRRQIYSLHCFGILLNSHPDGNPAAHIRDEASLFSNLVTGLQLPSEEIRGEVLFVLYKLCVLQATPWDDADCIDEDDDGGDSSFAGARLLLEFSLDALLKTQHDDVRMNCLALLTVLARKGVFEKAFKNNQSGNDIREADNLMQTDEMILHSSLINLFADAIKGPLLSSDTEVQISTLDLIFHSLSSDIKYVKPIQSLIEENIGDYVFEILRLSGNRDPLVISCLRVLVLLATAEEVFRQRLAVGFPTLLSVLRYVAEIPLHPVQPQVLRLVWSCISNCPGVLSIPQAEEMTAILTRIFRRHTSGEMGMLPETYSLVCSTFVEILKSPSSAGLQKIREAAQDASRLAVLSSLSACQGFCNTLMLYSLYLMKEAHLYLHKESLDTNFANLDMEKNIIETCEIYLLPWLEKAIDEGEEEDVLLEVLEALHLVLLRGSETHTQKFAERLASSSWFNLSFGCLGLFPTDQMKTRVYLMLSSVIDKSLGLDFGRPIRDSYVHLPSDPLDLLYLLGQRSSDDPHLASCQHAVLLMLYASSSYGESLADENQILASLEQYILVNSSNFSGGISDSMVLSQLVYLYGLVRGASISHMTRYSVEAEKALFHLIAGEELELLSMGTHPIALKWFFQQKEIMETLLNQILNFCRLYSTDKNQISLHSSKVQKIDIQTIAELVVSGDNYATSLLVSLLKHVREEGREEDVMYVLTVMAEIVNIFPDASNQFFLHSIGNSVRVVYYSICSSPQTFTMCSTLVFNILYWANHKTISQDGEWLAVTVKLLEFLTPTLTSHSCGVEEHLVMGTLCLILHHSSNLVLTQASKAILLNSSLASALESIVQTACAKGPALLDHDEETAMGECLIFVLLLYLFSLKSLHVLQEKVDWQDFLQTSHEAESPLSVICIKCHDLCRLIHFGSSLVKLVASQCLVEVLTRISEQMNRKSSELKCSRKYLQSMIAVSQGLVFDGDYRVATNCGICLSLILGWEKLGLPEKRAVRDSKWCRLIMEELAMALAGPGLASRYQTNHHKPAAIIAVALLRLDQIPGWMRSVFDVSCISGIIENLSPCGVSAEMVTLFRELMLRNYLNKEQVACLHNLFQVCRKQLYKDSSKEQLTDQCLEKVVAIPDDIGKVCSRLIQLIVSPAIDPAGIQTEHGRLLEEIDMFLQIAS